MGLNSNSKLGAGLNPRVFKVSWASGRFLDIVLLQESTTAKLSVFLRLYRGRKKTKNTTTNHQKRKKEVSGSTDAAPTPSGTKNPWALGTSHELFELLPGPRLRTFSGHGPAGRPPSPWPKERRPFLVFGRQKQSTGPQKQREREKDPSFAHVSEFFAWHRLSLASIYVCIYIYIRIIYSP